MYFKQIEVGPMANFVYLLGDPQTREAAIVDPAWEVDSIIETAETDGYQIKHILVTHGHPDHINGVDEMIAKTQAKVYMQKNEMPWLGEFKETAIKTEQDSIIQVGNLPITCVHTPGHTPGSQCFKVDQKLISGDTLFIGGCGRTDLPGGDAEQLYESLYVTLAKLDESCMLCPGHDYGDVKERSLAQERKLNPYLQYEHVKPFLKQRHPDLFKD